MFARPRDWNTLLLLRKSPLPSIFNSVEIWNSVSCIVLNFELADKNVIKEFGVSIDGTAQGYSFRPPKLYKPREQAFWCTENLHRIVWNSGRLDYSDISNILPRAVKGEYSAKGTEKCKIPGDFLDKDVQTLEDHGCPKVQNLVDEEIWICSTYPFRLKTTLHCAERKAKLFVNWIMRYLMLYSL